MALPGFEELTALTLDEVEAVIQTNLSPGWTFTFEEQEGGIWWAEILDAEGTVVFQTDYPDQRLTLFNAYGFVFRQQHKTQNPVWTRRRGDLRVAARRGLMHLPGSENIPDPGDLDPYSVYDPTPTKDKK